MNSAVSFFVGCVTFVLVMWIKCPIKKLTWQLSIRLEDNSEEIRRLYKRLNMIIFIVVVVVAMVVYYILYCTLSLHHFKWCCTLKAAAIAVALYMLYEQWMGKNHRKQ